MSDRHRTSAAIRRIVPGLVLALSLGFAVATPALASDETAATPLSGEETLAEQKEHWQARYRRLLRDKARLERNIASAKNNYTLAQRRNYPRGGARERYRLDAERGEQELSRVEDDIDRLLAEGRRDGALPGWFAEVEDESFDVPEPVAPAAPSARDRRDREGRNPIWFEDEDDD